MPYAHAVIELESRLIQRGDEVSADDFSADSWDELVEGGSISDEPYDEVEDTVPPPDVVEIDGVKYTKENTDA